MRWTFPDDQFTFTFWPSGPLYPTTPGTELTITLDSAGFTPADIRTLDGALILNSVIQVGSDGLIPQFLGPDTVNNQEVQVLWAQYSTSAPTRQLNARLYQRVQTLEDIVAELQTTGGGGGSSGPTSFVHTQDSPSTIWTLNHNLGYYPNVTIVDTGNEAINGDRQYLDINTIQLHFFAAVGGKAYCS